MNRMERITSQKKIILEYLKSVKTHPSAEEIYKAVKKKLPSISQGTVYRILNGLIEKGEALEISSEVSHFDGDTSPHSHFICENCKKIFDIFEEIKIPRAKKVKVGEVKNCKIYFYGLCKNCAKNKKRKSRKKR